MGDTLAPVDLVLVWHHHQPDYRNPRDGRSVLPWTRLHATKDYLDMARILERHPGIRVTFNLVPSLVDQLEAIAAGAPDRLFEILARPPETLAADERAEVIRRCLQAPPHAFQRWPGYRAVRAAVADPEAADDRTVLALEIWFLLAWLDPMFLESPESSRLLRAAGTDGGAPPWTIADRDALLALHQRLAGEVIPAYRALAAAGRVELSTSPYDHPILPLLLDTLAARRARPDLPLPAERLTAPDDARAHVENAIARHAAVFGSHPAGLWPSEGSVSPEVAALATSCGLRWMASDEGVLWRSLGEPNGGRGALYRPWRAPEGEVALFFRDHELSDRIGFVYQRWDPGDAARDFVARLRRIGRDYAGPRPPVVSVILDGENCWEHYAEDGGPFLDTLYREIAAAPGVRSRTPSEVLNDDLALERLPHLHSGSWIDADFHIWIGHAEKNRAWDLLIRTRRALLDAGATPASHPGPWRALRRAEGSDWFWWFGDDHPSADRGVFDHLFRDLLRMAHEEAGLTPAAALRLSITRDQRPGVTHEPPLGLIQPRIDGRASTFYEWHPAGRFVLDGGGSAMHRAAGSLRALHHGCDLERFYLRADFAEGPLPGADVDLALEIVEPRPCRLVVHGLTAGEREVRRAAERDGEPVAGARCTIGAVLELAVPFTALDWSAGVPVRLLVQVLRAGRTVESYPGESGLEFTVPDESFEAVMWSV